MPHSLMTLREAARIAGVPYPTAYYRMLNGTLKTRRLGKFHLTTPQAVRDAVNRGR